jgi:hypothetical protein
MNILKSYKGKTIRFRDNGKYGCLTDVANITGESIDKFTNSSRYKEVIKAFYKYNCEENKPHLFVEDNDVWVHWTVLSEFSYQCKDKTFSVWIDTILFAPILHPEIFPIVMNACFNH